MMKLFKKQDSKRMRNLKKGQLQEYGGRMKRG